MATRSGKRIHRSFQEIETKVETEFNPESERKTRRRVKVNNDVTNTCTKLRKRSNYVRYPSDETNEDEAEIVNEKEIKTASKMLKNTLTERDLNAPSNAFEEDNTTKMQRKSTRLARRTKKLDVTVQPMVIDNVAPEDGIEKPRKKKNKAKLKELQEPVENVQADDVVVIAKKKSKKTKKKGKKNSSVNEIGSAKNLSVHNTSADSFHSADGSPLKENHFNDEANAMSLDYQNESVECPKSDCVEPDFDHSNNTQIDNKENSSILKRKMCVRNSIENNQISTIPTTILGLTDDKCSANGDMDSNDGKQTPTKTKSSIRNSTFDKNSLSSVSNSPLDKSILNITCDASYDKKTPKRKSSVKNSTFDKVIISPEVVNSSIQNIIFNNNTPVKRRSSIKSSTFDKIDLCTSATESLDSTSEKINPNITYEKNDITKRISIDKSYLSTSTNDKKNSTFDKIDLSASSYNIKNSTFDKTESDLNSSVSDGINIILYPNDYLKLKPRTNKQITPPTKTQILSLTPDKSAKECVNESESQSELLKVEAENRSHDLTCDKNPTLNSTYEKIELKNATEKILIHSSDGSDSNVKINILLDKSETFTLSSTSDESKTENILNTTPLLVESSMEDTSITTDTLNKVKTPDCLLHPDTQMKRESTFTKDTPEVSKLSEPDTPLDRTPLNYLTVPSPGYTPFHSNHKSSHKKRTVLNVTHSLEKPSRKSSLVDVAPKTTKVMFCSPVDITAVTNERKTKVVKSSMKGSNKSFVFDDSVAMSPMELCRAGRKRSYTHGDAEPARAKRKRLGADLQLSVDRLSRPRGSAAAAAGKQPEPATPPRPVARPQCRSEGKAAAGVGAGVGVGGARTRLPNFAALHQRRFERMESLDEFKRRRERRARRLLTPTGRQPSPREIAETVESKPSTSKKIDTPVSTRKLPTLESLRPGYTRFGFKIDVAGNPFSAPAKGVEARTKEIKASRSRTGAGAGGAAPGSKLVLPSRAGVTSGRREAARSAAMKEKPRAAASAAASGKRDADRNQYRTIIKGVRTNRRFELQMKSRNVEG